MPRIVSIEFLNCIFHNWNRKPDGGCNRQVAPHNHPNTPFPKLAHSRVLCFFRT